MKEKDRAYLSIRMSRELHDKIQYVAGYHGRSMSAQILRLLQSCVSEFEKEHGKIKEHEE